MRSYYSEIVGLKIEINMKSKKELKPFEVVQIHLHYLDHHTKVQDNEQVKSEQMIKFFLSLTVGSIVLLSSLNNGDYTKTFLLPAIFICLSILIYHRNICFC